MRATNMANDAMEIVPKQKHTRMVAFLNTPSSADSLAFPSCANYHWVNRDATNIEHKVSTNISH